MVYSIAMTDVIYDPRISTTVSNLTEQGFSRLDPVSRPHKTPLTCGTILQEHHRARMEKCGCIEEVWT